MSARNEVQRDMLGEHLRVRLLEQYCASDSLSLEGLSHRFNEININFDSIIFKRASFLHWACSSKEISMEIVQYILALCPEAATISSFLFHPDIIKGIGTTAYPLHVACANSCCYALAQ